VLIDEKRKVAETLDEFRGQWKYNMMDEHVRAMNAVCPTFFQWDDHEVVNNWSDSKDLSGDDRYTRNRSTCCRPLRPRLPRDDADPLHAGRTGPRLPQDRLRPDARCVLPRPALLSRPERRRRCRRDDAESRVLGAEQIAWLKRELANSKATWKVIASDMPIGLIVWDDWRNSRARGGRQRR
jgi:alkaline phosphatase D